MAERTRERQAGFKIHRSPQPGRDPSFHAEERKTGYPNFGVATGKEGRSRDLRKEELESSLSRISVPAFEK